MEALSRKIGILILIIALSSHTAFHALYVSVIDLKHSAPNSTNATIKVFSDDLQNAIRNFNKEEYIAGSLSEFAHSNQPLIEAYFAKNFKVTINGKSCEMRLMNVEIEGDAHFIKLSIATPNRWNSISVKATYLSELFPDQSNILSISYEGEKRYARLTKKSPGYSVEF